MILRIYLILVAVLIVYFLIFLIINPTYGLIPYNMIIDLIHEKKVFYSSAEKNKIFPESSLLEKHWKMIQNEALNIMDIPYKNVGKNFISASEEFWEGWKTLPLRLFNKDNRENLNKCPIMKEILSHNSNITTAFFSIMEPGKNLSSHYGPFKGILRYHLGLLIPPKESGNCFISVDDKVYEWKEGEGVLFDETYKHFVRNETNYPRIILFLDIKRPFKTNIMKYLNDSIIWLIGNSPYNI